jgi:hypothetical protein
LCKIAGSNFSKLRIAQAYMKLVSIPENESGIRMVSLDSVGNYEIRMIEAGEAALTDAPLFRLELFDSGRQSSVDSRCCHDVEDAMAALEYFASKTNCSSEICRR